MDYSKPITRDDLDITIYNRKFSDWDVLFAKDTKSDAEMVQMGVLLHDYTIYSYAMFRLDGLPMKLYPYQDLILNDKHRFKIFRAANQIGKSLALDVKAACNLCWDHGHAHNEAIVSKSLPQAFHQMRRVKTLLNTARFDWNEDKGMADSMGILTVDVKGEDGKVKYTNMLICAPCTEGLLGYDLHELNLDEFEYWENVDIDYFFNQIAQPRTYSTKGSITIFSNPNGQDNIVAGFEAQKLLTGGNKWHTYIFNYMDKPGNTIEEYDQLKHELSRQRFESTVAAIRSISSKNYFTPDEIERSYDKDLTELKMVGKQCFFFLDVGAKHDQSVLVGGYVEPDELNPKFKHIYVPIIHAYPVGYPISRVVGSKTAEEDGWHAEKSVSDYIFEWSCDGVIPMFGVDVTGNSGIQPLLESVGLYNVQDVTYSGPVKSGMYQRLKYFMEKGLLHRVASKEFDYQFAHLIMKKTDRGYLKIHHETEDDLDDLPDGFAGLVYLADNPDLVEYTLKVF